MKHQLAMEIIDLPKPHWDKNITDTGENLMSEDDYQKWVESEKGGKNLVWNNYF